MNGVPNIATKTALEARDQRIAFRDKIAAKAAELAATKAAAVQRPVFVVAYKRPVWVGMPRHDDPCDTMYPEGYIESGPTKVTIKEIKLAVCAHFGIEMDDLTTPRRFVHLVRCRQVAMYLCKVLCKDRSYPEIGRQFGGRDHTTILHACRRIEKFLDTDSAIAWDVALIRAALGRE